MDRLRRNKAAGLTYKFDSSKDISSECKSDIYSVWLEFLRMRHLGQSLLSMIDLFLCVFILLFQNDIEMPIPKYFVLERMKALKEREKLLGQILSRLGAQDRDTVRYLLYHRQRVAVWSSFAWFVFCEQDYSKVYGSVVMKLMVKVKGVRRG